MSGLAVPMLHFHRVDGDSLHTISAEGTLFQEKHLPNPVFYGRETTAVVNGTMLRTILCKFKRFRPLSDRPQSCFPSLGSSMVMRDSARTSSGMLPLNWLFNSSIRFLASRNFSESIKANIFESFSATPWLRRFDSICSSRISDESSPNACWGVVETRPCNGSTVSLWIHCASTSPKT